MIPNEVENDEALSRFVLSKNDFRADGNVKPSAFIPYKYVELSVTRSQNLSHGEICSIGKNVATQRNMKFFGHAEIVTQDCLTHNLDVRAAPLIDNDRHANIVGWPHDKDSQKHIAIRLVAKAKSFLCPEC